MSMKPYPETFPYPLIALDETDSTNRYISQLCNELQESVAKLTTVTAEFQTAGKGQRGNTWEAERGKNLLFSFVLYPTFLEARRQFILSQIVSLSIKEELDRWSDEITIKWPNDIYWRDKKICGILIENDLSGHFIGRCISGVGININQKELSEESKKIYQAYYCGLCQKLKTNCGTKGQMLLSYDLTFLIVLLTGLYELENTETEFTCPLHPTKKRTAYINEATEYAADMNLILAYQNLLDDWKDEKSYTKKAFVKILDKDYTRIVSKYPRQVRALEEFMRKTAEAEKNKETNLDLVAGLTGEMLGEIMCWREDEWQEEMRTLGFYMGKFIYLMDAYEDYEADQKKNCYNPLVYMEKENDQEFDTFCKLLLTSMMSECAKSFERLPILLHADILRNILYSGVWSRYEYLQLRKKKLEEKKTKRKKEDRKK